MRALLEEIEWRGPPWQHPREGYFLETCPSCHANAGSNDARIHAPGCKLYAALSAALSAAPEASGWVEVTDDPATWPPNTDDPFLGWFGWWVACNNCAVHAGQYLRKHAEFISRDAQTSPPYFRWMPWPALAVQSAAAGKEKK